jgi:hypothetical protein
MRPNEKNEELAAYCKRIFSGAIRDKWIDSYIEVLSPDYRIIKEIRANLFLKWINNQFPQVPQIFIIRHPCAVVLSRMSLNWDTDSDIEPFLAQPELVEDYLRGKMEVIQEADSPEEKHAVIWCISNLIPLRQFCKGELNVVFYEDLVTQPEIEIPAIFRSLQLNFDDSLFSTLDTPSGTTVQTSAIVTGFSRVHDWQNKLNVNQIDKILSVVHRFGLEDLYGDSATPNKLSSWTN